MQDRRRDVLERKAAARRKHELELAKAAEQQEWDARHVHPPRCIECGETLGSDDIGLDCCAECK